MSGPIPDWLREKYARDEQAAELAAAAERTKRLRSRRFRHWLRATAKRAWPLLAIGFALGLWIGTTRTQAGRYELINHKDTSLFIDTATGEVRLLASSGKGWQFARQPLEDAPTPLWDWPDWDWRAIRFVVLAWALLGALWWLVWRSRRAPTGS